MAPTLLWRQLCRRAENIHAAPLRVGDHCAVRLCREPARQWVRLSSYLGGADPWVHRHRAEQLGVDCVQHPDFVSTFKRESVSLRRRPRHGLTKVLPWQVAMNSMYEDLAVAIVNGVREGQCAQAVFFACVALCCFKMAFKF